MDNNYNNQEISLPIAASGMVYTAQAQAPLADASMMTQSSAPVFQNPEPQTTGSQMMPSASAIAADDVDLIEKEWVEKAKHIVSQTKYDPYLQNKELSKMKAEYLKTRYKKDIKLVDD